MVVKRLYIPFCQIRFKKAGIKKAEKDNSACRVVTDDVMCASE